MNNEESLGLLASKPGNVKNAIIQKLSKQWPLTIKQLDHILKREFGMDVTYQAVHKAVTQLEEEKIIEKMKVGYQLHTDWIQSITKLSNQISTAYANNQVFDPEKEVVQIKFRTWVEMGRYFGLKFKIDYPNPFNKPTICNWIHVWPTVALSTEEIQMLSEIHKQCPNYSICPNDTVMDGIFSEWLSNVGNHSKIGVPVELSFDYIVRGEHVAQIHYENDFYQEVDKLYSQTKDPKKLNYKGLQKLATQKTEIYGIILKNSELADKLRIETLAQFRGR